VFVFQGGGALGAYQAGVYEGFAEHNIHPDWMAGVSIGAINAALIAGNTVEHRLQRLQDFWTRVSSAIPITPPSYLDPWRLLLNRLSSTATATFGVPGFFSPRFPGPIFASDGTPETVSLYDTTPLRETLLELIDFDLLNTRAIRLSVGAVNVRTGNSIYFDNRDPNLVFTPEHIMASGALPPGLPAVRIDDEDYWDGGIVSNTPLWYVLDDDPHLNAMIAQIDLFSARGERPQNLDEVLERQKDIQYSSKTRFNTMRAKEMEELRHALGRLLEKLPAKLRDDPDYKLLAPQCEDKRQITIAHLINRRFSTTTNAKDYEFSRATVRELWEAGLDDIRRTCAHREWLRAREVADGVRVFDLTR